MVRTMRVVGVDGKTGWQRARGATCKLMSVKFREATRCKFCSEEGGIGRSEFYFVVGVWFGVDPRIGQHILFDPEQNAIRHVKTLLRMPDVQKLDRDRIAAIGSTPWSIHEVANPIAVFLPKDSWSRGFTFTSVYGMESFYDAWISLSRYCL